MNDLLDVQEIRTKDTIQFKLWVIAIWFAVFAIGYGFRAMHWPFNSVLRIIGAGGFMAYSLSALIIVPRKTALMIVSACLSILWIIVIIWGIFFNGGYPFNLPGAGIQGLTFGFLFLLHLVSLYYMKKGRE